MKERKEGWKKDRRNRREKGGMEERKEDIKRDGRKIRRYKGGMEER